MRLIQTIFALLLIGPVAWAGPQLRQLGMVNVPGAPGFDDVAIARGMLVMAHNAASTVDVLDLAKRRVVAQISGVQSPRGIAVDEQNGKIYVADAASDSIAVITTDTWKVAEHISLPGSPDTLLLGDSGKRLYWTDPQNASIFVLDLLTRQNVGKVEVGGEPRSLALDPDRHLLFATVQDTHQVLVLDSELKIVARHNLNASQPTGLIYDPRFRELYVAVRYAVLAINAETGAEINRVPASAGVDKLWLDPESRTVYAAGEGSLLTLRANGRLVAEDEIHVNVKGHTVAYDTEKKMLLLPGGREGKSKVMLLRPVSSEAAPGTEQSAESH